jgi:hypothetical protein
MTTARPSLPRRLLAAPLTHFIMLGLALFALTTSRGGSSIVPPPVVVSPGDVAARRAEWTWQHGVAPNAAAAAQLDAELLDEAVLHQAALDAGIDRRDATVRRRIAQLATFTGEDAAIGASLERTAAALGLARNDLVVQRHLVQLARLAAGRLGAADMPAEDELAAHLARHAERFAEPARVTLTHVYLARDRNGATLEADAAALLDRIRRDRVPAAEAVGLGNAFIQGATLTGSRAEIERTFGASFTAVWQAEPGTWIGPVASPFGLHLVWIVARTPAMVPPLAAVRGRVLHEVLRERASVRRRERVRALRTFYAARIETTGSAEQD